MKWEYKVHTIAKGLNMETELNTLGRDGWELSGFWVQTPAMVVGFFKRPAKTDGGAA